MLFFFPSLAGIILLFILCNHKNAVGIQMPHASLTCRIDAIYTRDSKKEREKKGRFAGCASDQEKPNDICISCVCAGFGIWLAYTTAFSLFLCYITRWLTD